MKALAISVLAAIALSACDGHYEPTQKRDNLQTQSDVISNMLADESGPVMVIAHRACWLEGAPENSLAAISECIEMGADMIEIDVRLTSDRVPVLLHDSTLDRTTNGTGNIDGVTYAYAESLSLRSGGGGADAPMTNHKIPTLAEALETARGQILINLDVKLDIFDDAYAVVRELGVEHQILMKMGAAANDPALANAAFVGKTLFMPLVRQCTEKHISRGTYCTSAIADVVPGYSVYSPVAYEVTYVDPAFLKDGVASMTEMSGRIWVNTLLVTHAAGHTDELAKDDPDAHWGQVVRDGANMIQTDRPRELIAYLSSQGLRSP